MKTEENKLNVRRTISLLEKNINLGYTHDNFVSIANLFTTLNTRMDRLDVLLLEEFWRNSYTDSCEPEMLNTVCKQLKHKYRNTK